jgi:L-aminopeptidase/D-esterase-like protein
MTGISWVNESGTMAGPICITNTHAAGVAHGSIVRWTATHHPAIAEAWLLPIAAETWDGYLNDINGHHVTEDGVVSALKAAATGPIAEGSVGGGTGMNCYSFKGGSGTSSRVVDYAGTRYTVGVFLQANFGARHELVIAGVPLGRELADDDPIAEFFAAPPGAGSCIAVVLTDAPLLPDQCRAMARRVTLGLARTGTTGSHFSGDLFFAASVANPGAITPGFRTLFPEAAGRYDQLRFIPWGCLDPFFSAVVEATEEAVVNCLVANDDMTGFRGHRSPGLPVARAINELRERGVLTEGPTA